MHGSASKFNTLELTGGPGGIEESKSRATACKLIPPWLKIETATHLCGRLKNRAATRAMSRRTDKLHQRTADGECCTERASEKARGKTQREEQVHHACQGVERRVAEFDISRQLFNQ